MKAKHFIIGIFVSWAIGGFTGFMICKRFVKTEIITIYQSKDTTHWERDDLSEDSVQVISSAKGATSFAKPDTIHAAVNYSANAVYFHLGVSDSGFFFTDSIPKDGMGVVQPIKFPYYILHGKYRIRLYEVPKKDELGQGETLLTTEILDSIVDMNKYDIFDGKGEADLYDKIDNSAAFEEFIKALKKIKKPHKKKPDKHISDPVITPEFHKDTTIIFVENKLQP